MFELNEKVMIKPPNNQDGWIKCGFKFSHYNHDKTIITVKSLSNEPAYFNSFEVEANRVIKQD